MEAVFNPYSPSLFCTLLTIFTFCIFQKYLYPTETSSVSRDDAATISTINAQHRQVRIQKKIAEGYLHATVKQQLSNPLELHMFSSSSLFFFFLTLLLLLFNNSWSGFLSQLQIMFEVKDGMKITMTKVQLKIGI
jgi:hypothetical protein